METACTQHPLAATCQEGPFSTASIKALEPATAQALALGPDGHGRTARNADAVLASSLLLLLAE